MLYFASFICPGHTESAEYFDENRKKPCVGTCGHTICLVCVEASTDCPVCKKENAFIGKTINYGAMTIMNDFRSNILQVFKNWWGGERFGSGLCSKCFEQTDKLRICLHCNSDLCVNDDGNVKLSVLLHRELLELSQCVVCADCVLEHHDHPEPLLYIMTIDEIKVDSDMRRITARIIMELLKKEEATCIFPTVLEELDGLEERDCGYLGELIKSQVANKFIENTLVEMDQVFNGPICECTRVYEDLLKVTNKKETKYIYRGMSLSRVEEFAMGCSLNFKENSEWRSELYSVLRENPPNIDYTQIINTINGCSLCIYHDYFNEDIDRETEYYQKHCMEIYENYWKSEMPSIDIFCFRCLSQLHYRLVGRSCWEVKEKWEQERSELNGEELIEHQRRFGARLNDTDDCKNEEECILSDPKFWKYAVKLEIREKAYKIFKEQIEETIDITDDSPQSKLLETLGRMDKCIGEIDLREDTKEELLEKVARIDEILEELKVQWEQFKSGFDEVMSN